MGEWEKRRIESAEICDSDSYRNCGKQKGQRYLGIDLFGVRTLGRIMGIILVADGLAESLMRMLVGVLYKASKSLTTEKK
jgi:hypothetical protein